MPIQQPLANCGSLTAHRVSSLRADGYPPTPPWFDMDALGRLLHGLTVSVD